MASVIRWALGLPSEAASEEKTRRGLPAVWYRSPGMYELERRAIFSKKWIMVTHKNRLKQAGDYIRITEAGFAFILVLDRQGTIGGFHNICRHRGFPLIHDEAGNTKILSCKYHGWSYGINGNLAKAPHLETLPDFRKEDNSLLPVHVHVDDLGFLWVNLEATEERTTSWEAQFPGVHRHPRFDAYNFSEYTFDHTWGMQGDYNWKTLADNYNECLHCRTAHPDTAGVVDISVYRVEGVAGSLQHFNKRQEQNQNNIVVNSTYYYPNACMTVTPHFFYLMRCVPTSATTCSMEYEVYRHKDASDEEFDKIDQMYKRVLTEDKWLCNNTQLNLNSGVYLNGQMHPQYEYGPLYFQSLVRQAVTEHKKLEDKMKTEIWPASQRVAPGSGTYEDAAFCSGLACSPEKKSAVDW